MSWATPGSCMQLTWCVYIYIWICLYVCIYIYMGNLLVWERWCPGVIVIKRIYIHYWVGQHSLLHLISTLQHIVCWYPSLRRPILPRRPRAGCTAVSCSGLQRVAVCDSVLQCVALCIPWIHIKFGLHLKKNHNYRFSRQAHPPYNRPLNHLQSAKGWVYQEATPHFKLAIITTTEEAT